VLAQERIEMRVGSKHRDVLSQDIMFCQNLIDISNLC
jgi:hypothetical protein